MEAVGWGRRGCGVSVERGQHEYCWDKVGPDNDSSSLGEAQCGLAGSEGLQVEWRQCWLCVGQGELQEQLPLLLSP